MIWPWAFVVRRRQGTVSCIPRPPFFLLTPISSGERVGVQVQGCVQTEGLQVFPLSQEARQVCPLTGPHDPNQSARLKLHQFNVPQMYSVLSIGLLCFFLISFKEARLLLLSFSHLKHKISAVSSTPQFSCSFYVFLCGFVTPCILAQCLLRELPKVWLSSVCFDCFSQQHRSVESEDFYQSEVTWVWHEAISDDRGKQYLAFQPNWRKSFFLDYLKS